MKTSLALLMALPLAACVAAPSTTPSQVPVASTSLGLGAAPAPQVQADWWKAFNDPQLDRLVAQLLTGNPTLQGALARIRAAQAELSVARTAQYPNINIDSSEPRQLLSNDYRNQPTMKAPSTGAPLLWGNGIRVIKSFTMPGRVRGKVALLADSMKVTPFLIYLTIFSIAMARWSGMERFPLRVLGDKRGALDLSNTVGLMFCADAMEISVPAGANFERVMRGLLAEYDASLSLRIPSLHFWAPHAVMPGIEPHPHENKIPAVFNYYSVGTAREKAERRAMPDGGAVLPWPPQITTITQTWPRRSSPLFLHVNDQGHDVQMALHFFQGVVSPAEQDSFTALLFQVFAETVPA